MRQIWKSFRALYFASLMMLIGSGLLIAGILMWYLYRAIARTGALDKFASGREVRGISA